MITTIEISNYPLNENYKEIIFDFIDRCKKSDLKIKVSATSTQMQGEYDEVMRLLQKEIKNSFDQFGKMVFVIKILKGELDLDFSM